MIYKSGQKGDPVSPKSPLGGIKHYPSSKKTMVNDPGSSTPNNSSSNPNNSISTPNNSINSMNSTDKSKDKRTSYQYLKVNDLQPTKLRNNQSSYYGMGGGGYPEARRDKNMTISYEFKNRNEARSKSSHSSKKNHN